MNITCQQLWLIFKLPNWFIPSRTKPRLRFLDSLSNQGNQFIYCINTVGWRTNLSHLISFVCHLRFLLYFEFVKKRLILQMIWRYQTTFIRCASFVIYWVLSLLLFFLLHHDKSHYKCVFNHSNIFLYKMYRTCMCPFIFHSHNTKNFLVL